MYKKRKSSLSHDESSVVNENMELDDVIESATPIKNVLENDLMKANENIHLEDAVESTTTTHFLDNSAQIDIFVVDKFNELNMNLLKSIAFGESLNKMHHLNKNVILSSTKNDPNLTITNTNSNMFIQKVEFPVKIYLFSKKQLKLMEAESQKLLKMSRNTSLFDATGNCFANLEQYIAKCYSICVEKKTALKLVVKQLCCTNFLKIVYKDINACFSDPEIVRFLKWQFIYAVNICNINTFFHWINNMLILLLNPNETEIVKDTIKNMKKISEHEYYEEYISKSESTPFHKFERPNYKNNPFFTKTLQIYLKIKKSAEKTSLCKNVFYSVKMASSILIKYSPYAALWTNLMGHPIGTKENTRISNSPVESYFNLMKYFTLDGEANLTPSVYVRKSYGYSQAKVVDIENKYLNGDQSCNKKRNSRKNMVLYERKWKRTPKKQTTKRSKKKIVYKKFYSKINMLKNKKFYNKINVWKNMKFILYSFNKLYQGKTIFYSPTIDTMELKCLEPRNQLYNQIIDIYVQILLHKNNNSYAFSTLEGEYLFFGDGKLNIPTEDFNQIFIPIIHNYHFTLVYLNVKTNHFHYLDPWDDNDEETNQMFEIFKKIIPKNNDWNIKNIKRDFQTDYYNCGIFVCQYVEAILEDKPLINLPDPDEHRIFIKNKIIEYSDDMKEICVHCGLYVEPNSFLCQKCKRPACDDCYIFYYKTLSQEYDHICIFCNE